MRDVLFGFATWLLSLGLLVGTWIGSLYFFGPPANDRIRSVAYIGGGAVPIFILLLLFLLLVILKPIGNATHQ